MASLSFTLLPHPLGVKPSGNALSDGSQLQRPFVQLSDEILLSILDRLDTRSLLALGSTCKVLYAFSRFDELWRAKMIEIGLVPSAWLGTWYASYAGVTNLQIAQVSAAGLASDALYRPFLCAKMPLAPYVSQISVVNQIACIGDLTAEEFDDKWVDKPFVLQHPIKEWPLFGYWSMETLRKRYSEVVFKAEAVDWPLGVYMDYLHNNEDESPLYLFDRAFVEKMSISGDPGGDFWPPQCFGDDLFSLLGKHHPDHRWLIVGPQRSGSTFHKDPNATSAWNAVIQGSKYWIMFPPEVSPPGVFVSQDQSEVTSPLSIAEWLIGFHQEARATPGCREGICNAGEVLHVPSGWWHLVVNVEPSIAITQNFVPRGHLGNVLDFLRDKPEQISGFGGDIGDAFKLFESALEGASPQVAQLARRHLSQRANGKKRKWEELVFSNTDAHTECLTEQHGFSFDFKDDTLNNSE